MVDFRHADNPEPFHKYRKQAMTDRERFEAFIAGPLYRRSAARYDDNDTHQWAGRYICPTTQLAWEAYCKALESRTD